MLFCICCYTEIGGKFQEAVLIILCSKNIFSLVSSFAGIQLLGLIILNDVSMILGLLNGLEIFQLKLILRLIKVPSLAPMEKKKKVSSCLQTT